VKVNGSIIECRHTGATGLVAAFVPGLSPLRDKCIKVVRRPPTWGTTLLQQNHKGHPLKFRIKKQLAVGVPVHIVRSKEQNNKRNTTPHAIYLSEAARGALLAASQVGCATACVGVHHII
jgi:hypothetical protein